MTDKQTSDPIATLASEVMRMQGEGSITVAVTRLREIGGYVAYEYCEAIETALRILDIAPRIAGSATSQAVGPEEEADDR